MPKTGNQAKAILVADLLLAVVLGNLALKKAKAQTTEHPFISADDINADTCLSCHPNKKEGKSVHPAVGLGCKTCHEATSEEKKGKTKVTLVAEGSDLCARCHAASKDPVQHRPYKSGQCLVCHEPHASDFPKQTRAEISILCQSCHGNNQPDVKVNADAKTVSLLGGRRLDLASYEKAPKIELGHSKKNSPFVVSPPPAVKDFGKADAELNCMTCHDPHASKAEHLLRGATESGRAAQDSFLSYGARTSFIGGRQ
jgi:predicted CXXCH cytochrome family protein